MSKFKVGDKVKIKFGNGNVGWVSEMRALIGEIVTISKILYEGTRDMQYEVNENIWSWNECDFELVEPREFIVIRRDKQDVIASHKRGDEIVKTAKATCAPSDEFNFETGAKLAFDRLMGQRNIEEAIKAWNKPSPAPEPKYYSGKVFAVRASHKFHTNDEQVISRNGHIFEIKDGRLVGDYAKHGIGNDIDRFESFSDFCEARYSTEWAEVKE